MNTKRDLAVPTLICRKKNWISPIKSLALRGWIGGGKLKFGLRIAYSNQKSKKSQLYPDMNCNAAKFNFGVRPTLTKAYYILRTF